MNIGQGRKEIVLVFSKTQKLIAIGKSANSMAKWFGLTAQQVIFAAKQRKTAVNDYFFRYLPKGVIVETEDIGSLTVQELDNLAGQDRVIKIRTKKGYRILKNKTDENTSSK